MAENTVLFRVDVDESGAVSGFRVSREELKKLRQQTDRFGVAATKSGQKAKRLGDATERTGRQARKTSESMRTLRRVVGTVFTIATVRTVINYADTMKNLNARLRIATKSTEEFERAQVAVLEIANETYSSLESTTELYARLSLAVRDTSFTQEEILQVTETLNKAYQSAGATTQEATASVIQLSQGLAAGALRGDEFRSVMEQAPRVVTALTDALGLTRGELRLLANEGGLLTGIIVQALKEQAEAVDKDFKNIEVTVGRSLTLLKNETLSYIGAADAASGASARFAEAIGTVTENLDAVLNVGIAVTLAGLTAMAPAFARAGAAATGFFARMGPIGLVAIAVGLVVEAILEIGDAMVENAGKIRDFTTALAELSTIKGLTTFADGIAEEIDDLKQELSDLVADTAKLENADQPWFVDAEGFRNVKDAIAENKIEMAELTAVIAANTAARDKALGTIEEMTEAQNENTLTAKEMLEASAILAAELADQKDALDVATKALEKYGSTQDQMRLRVARFVLESNLLNRALKDLPDQSVTLKRALEALRTEFELDALAISASTDKVRVFELALAGLRQTTVDTVEQGFLQLEIMLEEISALISPEQWLEYAEAIRKARLEIEEFNDEGEGVGAGTGGYDFLKDRSARGFFNELSSNIADAFDEAGLKAGRSIGEELLKTIEANKIGFANAIFSSVANFKALKDQGATGLEAANLIVANSEIPIVSEIAQLLAAVNDIVGGKLFGTRYATDQSRREIGIGAAGISGGLEINQSRERSFFRGTKRRALFEDLDPETERAAAELFQAALDALRGAVEVLGVEAPQFIAGKFIEEFDADGNLTKSISEFLGRSFEEGFEEFSFRLIAENIIAAVGQAVGDVEVPRSVSQTIGAGDFGDRGDFGDFGDRGRGGDFGGPGAFGGVEITREVTEMVNEAQAIAERWRDSAELLLEGAQLLLVAQSAIQEGVGLLDSLTASVDLVEDLQGIGETLVETFQRLIDSAAIMTDALSILDISLDLSRESFVRMAEEFTDAAGGINNAAQLWRDYFETFYEADEVLKAQLRIAQGTATSEFADVGLGPDISKDEFRKLFEDALPTLSGAALNEWLEAARALGIVISLEDELAAIRIAAAAELAEAAEIMTAALSILGISLDLSSESFVQMAKDFTDAAGGIDNARQLWRDYFNIFYEADELIEAQLRIAQETATSALAGIGLGPDVSLDEFRKLFEDIFPTLSAEARVQWLEVARAIGAVSLLNEALAAGLIDNSADVATAAAIMAAELAASADVMTDALAILDISLDLSSENFVQLAKEFTDAAGGIDSAARLWGDYFKIFYEADELVEARLRVAKGTAASELADIGLGPDISKDEFRRLFEEVLPTLSAEALNEWLDAARALGIVFALEEDLAALRLDNIAELIDAVREFFGVAREQIADLLGGTINDLRRELLTDEEVFNELRAEAIGLAGRVSSAGTAQEVTDIVRAIERLVRDARGLAGDPRFNLEFIDFLESVGAASEARLAELEAQAIAELELAQAETASRESFVQSVETFDASVTSASISFEQAANRFSGAVDSFGQALGKGLSLTVESPPGTEIGGLT